MLRALRESRGDELILRHANVTATKNIYVKTVSADAASAMKYLKIIILPLLIHHCEAQMGTREDLRPCT